MADRPSRRLWLVALLACAIVAGWLLGRPGTPAAPVETTAAPVATEAGSSPASPAEPPSPTPPVEAALRRRVRVLLDGSRVPVAGVRVFDRASAADCLTGEDGSCALDCTACDLQVGGPWLGVAGIDATETLTTLRVTSDEPTGELELVVPDALDVELVRVEGPALTASFRCDGRCVRTLPAGTYLLNTLEPTIAARGPVAKSEVPERHRVLVRLDGPLRHRLIGRVVDEHGQQIAGARVTLSPGRGLVTSDAGGRIDPLVGAGPLFVHVEADGFVDARDELDIAHDVERTWSLTAASALVVRVVDPQGRPVREADVEVRSQAEDPDGAERRTTTNGIATFRRFGAGTYLVTAVHSREAEGELRATAEVRIERGRPADVGLVLRPTGGHETLVVSLVDVAEEVLAAGVTVEVRCGELVRSQRVGTYRAGTPIPIDGLVAEGCTVEARLDGLPPIERAVDVPGSVVLRPE